VAYTPNPATPGYHADTPSPSGPYTPQTPGTAYSPYANHPTPSPMAYQGSVSVSTMNMPTGRFHILSRCRSYWCLFYRSLIVLVKLDDYQRFRK
jgi:hypothetical protein